jgi:integrase
VALIQEHAASEPSLERVAQLEALARQIVVVSPHPLRHGLADACGEMIRQILGHSHVATTLKYGKPTEEDLRTALEAANNLI